MNSKDALAEVAVGYDGAGDGRSAALARTCRELGDILGHFPAEGTRSGFHFAALAPVSTDVERARARTCSEIAERIGGLGVGLGEVPDGRAAWAYIVLGLEDRVGAAADGSPERARYAAMIATYQREHKTMPLT